MLTFFFGSQGGKYKLLVTLGRNASTTIEVSQVIAAQQPDREFAHWHSYVPDRFNELFGELLLGG